MGDEGEVDAEGEEEVVVVDDVDADGGGEAGAGSFAVADNLLYISAIASSDICWIFLTSSVASCSFPFLSCPSTFGFSTAGL